MAQGMDVQGQNMLFSEWLKIWLREYAFPSVKLSTYGSYHTYIHKHIIPTFPKVSLKELRPDHLQKFLNHKLQSGRLDNGEGLSANTVRKINVMIGTALRQALHSNLVSRNVADMVKLPPIDQQEMRVLSMEEQHRLEEACLQSPDLAAMGVYLSVNTGMRLGEILGLTWDDVDLQNGIIYVRQTLNRLKVYDTIGEANAVARTVIEIGTPKSKHSKREIPLFEACRNNMLLYQSKQREAIQKLDGAYEDMGYVFATPLGRYMEPKTFQDLFKRQVAASGIADANFHALRHTFATRSLEAGMDILVLSRILGHAQPSTTLNKYGHALPDHKRSSMAGLGEYLEQMRQAQREEGATENTKPVGRRPRERER